MNRKHFPTSIWFLMGLTAFSDAAVTICSSDETSTVVCSGGTWPSVSDPPISGIPLNVSKLTLTNMTINGTENVQPLPSHIAGLISLDFDNITSFSADGMNVQFPLQSLTTNIAKNRIQGLTFNLVNVSVINEGFLQGFTGLQALYLAQCGISVIHPRSFYALVDGRSWLSVLSIINDDVLTKFPWDVLFPVAKTIMVMIP